MPLLDDRGRLFGKVNLIDAAVVLVALGLIPVGYASWTFFKTPLPTIETVTPSVMTLGKPDQTLQVTGQHLRPFLRMTVGAAATTYLFESPGRVEIRVPALPPGAYDLVLFDETMEIGRKAGAITVVASPPPIVRSVTPGRLEFTREPQRVFLKGEGFPGSLKAAIGPFEASYKSESPTTAELLVPAVGPGTFDLVLSDALQELVRVPKAITVPKPAIESITPHVVEYTGEAHPVQLVGRHLQPGIRMFVGWREVTPQLVSHERGELQLPPLPVGTYDLAVFDSSLSTEFVRYAKAITIQPARPLEFVDLTMRVRFITRPEVLAAVKEAQKEQASMAPTSGAVLVSYEIGPELIGTTRAELREGDHVVVVGVVRLTASRKPNGWQFETQPLLAGAPFVLRTQTYQLNGEILSIDTSSARGK